MRQILNNLLIKIASSGQLGKNSVNERIAIFSNSHIPCPGILYLFFIFTLVAMAQPTNRIIMGDQTLFSHLTDRDMTLDDIASTLRANAQAVDVELWRKLIKSAEWAYFIDSHDRCIRLYTIALLVAEILNDKKLMALSNYYIGYAYYGYDMSVNAIRFFIQSKKLFEISVYHKDVIYVLAHLGAAYLRLEDYEEAKKYSLESLRLANILKDEKLPDAMLPDDYGVALAILTLGAVFEADGDYETALGYFQKSLTIYTDLYHLDKKYAFHLAGAYSSIGRIHNSKGDNDNALIYLHKALELSEKMPYIDKKADVLNDLGVLYLEQEDYDKALFYFSQSIRIYRSINNITSSSRLLLNIGVVHHRQANYDKALDFFHEGLELAKKASNKDLVIATKEGIGAIFHVKNRYEEALEILDDALTLARSINNKTRIAELLWRKAEVMYSLKNYDQAEKLSEESLKIADQLRFFNLSYYSASLLGKSQLALKKTELAYRTLTNAIGRVEEMREKVVGLEHEQQLFFENKLEPYHTLIDISIESNKPLDAIGYAESAKGRALLDVLRKGRIHITKAMSDKEKEEEQRLNQLIVDLNNQIREEFTKQTSDIARVARIKEQLESARFKYTSFENILYASHPELKTQRGQPPPLDNKLLGDLVTDNNTAFVEYVAKQDGLFIFVITQGDRDQPPDLKVRWAAIPRADLEKLAISFHNSIAGRQITFLPYAVELYNILIKPVESLLEGKETICIVPDGILWDVPFQALRSKENRYLTETHAIYYAPSLSVLVEMMRGKNQRHKAQSLLALGNPVIGSDTVKLMKEQLRGESFEPLPDAEVEVKSLERIFPDGRSKIFIGMEASEGKFRSLASSSNILHFATHGVLDNRQPLYSYLLLSRSEKEGQDDGLIEAREIMNMDLSADLAVLSACDTARGRIGAGEGVIGMAWAFFVAGCRTTMVSQWKVDSAGTSELMVDFYKNLKNENMQERVDKAGALRKSAMKIMKDKRYQHPFYWAGFVIVGSNR